MSESLFKFNKEVSKSMYTCTAWREIPVPLWGLGSHYKENITPRVLHKLWSINSALKFILAPKVLAPKQHLQSHHQKHLSNLLLHPSLFSFRHTSVIACLQVQDAYRKWLIFREITALFLHSVQYKLEGTGAHMSVHAGGGWDLKEAKSNHTTGADDEISFANESISTREKPHAPGWGKPTSKPKTQLFFFLCLLRGQMESPDIMSHYSWKLNGWSEPQSSPETLEMRTAVCLLKQV